MRHLALLGICAAIACGGDNTGPVASAFGGAYTLAKVGVVSVPGTIYTIPSTGGSYVVQSGSLIFDGAGRFTISQTSIAKASSSSASVPTLNATTYSVHQVGDSAIFLLLSAPGGVAGLDTAGSVRQAGSSSLLVTFRGPGLDQYTYIR